MVYRVFISTTMDDDSSDYLSTVKQALWNLKDFPVSPITMEELATAEGNPKTLIRQTIDEADIFIGVYGSSFGDYKDLSIADLIQFEYSYALERGVSTLIFMPAEHDPDDTQLEDFAHYIKQRQVVMTFNNLEDLSAKVILAVTTHRMHKRKRSPFNLPGRGLAPSPDKELEQGQELVTHEFERDVQRAFDLIQDELEELVQRSVAVQQARNIAEIPKPPKFGYEMNVNPIFGEPNMNAQFQADIFMITPFRDEFDTVYRNVIEPTVTDMNLTIKRGDEFNSVSGQIMSEVWAAINACRLVIVETSEVNANVYYELGIAHTLGKPAILITQAKDIEDFPFDIRHLRFIVYENTIAGGEALEQALRDSIIRIINDLEDGV